MSANKVGHGNENSETLSRDDDYATGRDESNRKSKSADDVSGRKNNRWFKYIRVIYNDRLIASREKGLPKLGGYEPIDVSRFKRPPVRRSWEDKTKPRIGSGLRRARITRRIPKPETSHPPSSYVFKEYEPYLLSYLNYSGFIHSTRYKNREANRTSPNPDSGKRRNKPETQERTPSKIPSRSKPETNARKAEPTKPKEDWKTEHDGLGMIHPVEDTPEGRMPPRTNEPDWSEPRKPTAVPEEPMQGTKSPAFRGSPSPIRRSASPRRATPLDQQPSSPVDTSSRQFQSPPLPSPAPASPPALRPLLVTPAPSATPDPYRQQPLDQQPWSPVDTSNADRPFQSPPLPSPAPASPPASRPLLVTPVPAATPEPHRQQPLSPTPQPNRPPYHYPEIIPSVADQIYIPSPIQKQPSRQTRKMNQVTPSQLTSEPKKDQPSQTSSKPKQATPSQPVSQPKPRKQATPQPTSQQKQATPYEPTLRPQQASPKSKIVMPSKPRPATPPRAIPPKYPSPSRPKYTPPSREARPSQPSPSKFSPIAQPSLAQPTSRIPRLILEVPEGKVSRPYEPFYDLSPQSYATYYPHDDLLTRKSRPSSRMPPEEFGYPENPVKLTDRSPQAAKPPERFPDGLNDYLDPSPLRGTYYSPTLGVNKSGLHEMGTIMRSMAKYRHRGAPASWSFRT